MKKILLALLFVAFTGCNQTPKDDYEIVQKWYNGCFQTYVWYKRSSSDSDIAMSYTLSSEEVTKTRIKQDSIKAVNYIDCLLNGRNCYIEKHNYKIEQEFRDGYFNTWIWHKGGIVKSYAIPENEVTKKLIKSDSLKAVKWIEKVKLLTSK